MKTYLVLLFLVMALSLFTSCVNSQKVSDEFKPDAVQYGTRKQLYSDFKIIGKPYRGMSMIGTSSGFRGTESVLLQGGYLLEYSVHYRGFSVFNHKGSSDFKSSDNDSISNLRLNPNKGWTLEELNLLYTFPPIPAEQVAASDR